MYQLPNEAVIHNGRFHADDVFSATLLKILNSKIHISRVSVVPENFDGFVFDFANSAFDYHNSHKKCRENGLPYASFGLLWSEYGHTLSSGYLVVTKSIEAAIKACETAIKNVP